MESVFYIFTLYTIHSVRLLQDIQMHARGIPLGRLQGIVEAEMLWCCEADRAIYPIVRVFAWLGLYHLLTRKRLHILEARGLVRRRKPSPTSTNHELYVLTRLGQRFLRGYHNRSTRYLRRDESVESPSTPLMA